MSPADATKGTIAFRVALLLTLLLAVARGTVAERLPSKAYTTADGLAHNRVKRIVQDSRGFLWFCTADGLSRFDGYQFTNYGIEDGLPAPSVNDLLEAGDGVYWIATNSDGVVHFTLLAGARSATGETAPTRFTTYPVGDEPVSNRVNVLYRNSGGRLWAGTDGGLFYLDEAKNESAFRRADLGIPSHSDIQVQVWALLEDRAGNLWIGTKFGLVRRSPDGRMIHYAIQPSLNSDTVSALLLDGEGRLWVGHEAGLHTFAPDQSLPSPGGNRDRAPAAALPAVTRRYTTADGLDNDNVLALHQTADGRIWIRTFGNGLTEFDGKIFHTYLITQRFGDSISTLTEDGAGNLWLGTRTSGALKITRHGFVTYGEADGLGQSVSSVFENEAGALYASSSVWRVSRFEGGRFTTIRSHLPATVTDASWRDMSGVIEDHTGQWWVATRVGLYRLPKVNRFEQLARSRPVALYTTRDGLANDDVTRLFEDSRGDIWIASWVPGREVLTRWERATDSFHRYTETDGLRPFTSALTFREDASGNVWAGFREGGLARYRAGRFETLGPEDGLPAGAINSIYLDERGRLWVAVMQGGLCRIDDPGAERPRVVTYTKAEGLASNAVNHVTGDLSGRIYVGSSRGIDRLDPETGRIKHYTTADGLTGGEFKAAFRDRSGALWFATTTGLSRLLPEPEKNTPPSPILIGGLSVAGRPQPLNALGERDVSGLELDTGENNVQITFFGIDFNAGEALRYQYKLEGANADWSAPTEGRTVNYASLAPGAYRFLVRAVSVNGLANEASESPATVSFRIFPPVWRRPWFVAMAAAVIAAAVFAFARSRYKRLKALRESENRFRTLAETASDAIITIDEESRIVLVNQAAEKVFGYTRQEMVGADLTMLMPEYLRHLHHAGFTRYQQTGKRHISWEAVELPGLHKNGREIPLEISFGEFVRNGRRFFTGIARDTTERKRAEEALRRSREERLAELERVRKRIATDLHDDIGSSLTRISLLSEVARRQADGTELPLAAPLSSIARLSRELVDSMSDIVWAINPNKDHLSDLSQRMRHFASDVFTARRIDFRFRAPDAGRDIKVGANVRRELF